MSNTADGLSPSVSYLKNWNIKNMLDEKVFQLHLSHSVLSRAHSYVMTCTDRLNSYKTSAMHANCCNQETPDNQMATVFFLNKRSSISSPYQNLSMRQQALA
jgi:hypothetical protein